MPLVIVNHVYILRDGRGYMSLGDSPSLPGQMLMNPIWQGCFAANHRFSDDLPRGQSTVLCIFTTYKDLGRGLFCFVLVMIFN